MTIQGGGGGKKIPPGGTPPAARPPNAPAKTDAPATKAQESAPTPLKDPRKPDAFVGKSSDAGPFKSTGEVKLDDAFLQAGSPSGIDNLVRLLESARGQLLTEHSRGRAEAQKCLEKLVQAGFSEAQLAGTRAELYELRKRMAAVRKRLQQLQRRLKAAFAQAGKTADANLQKLLGAQLERLKQLEPGMSRSLGALMLMEQAYSAFADGSPPVLRARVEGGGSHELVSTLSTLTPGAVVARALHGLVNAEADEGALSAPLPAASEGEPAAARGMRAFAEALLPVPRKTPAGPSGEDA